MSNIGPLLADIVEGYSTTAAIARLASPGGS